MLPLRWIDDFLNGITMYRLLLYGLSLLVAVGVVFGFGGQIAIWSPGLLLSASSLLIVCYLSNRLLAFVFHAKPNSESALITALILACLLPPPATLAREMATVIVGLIAMASKYFFAWRRKHIFNPAAIAAAIASLTGLIPVTWWVGSPAMAIFTLILGLLVIRKIRHAQLFTIFVLTAVATMALVGLVSHQPLSQTLFNALLSWPLIFFGSIMLTEPATMPGDKYYQGLFATIVGVIFGCQLHLGPIASSPQVALIAGNLFAFAVNPADRLILTLTAKRILTPQAYDFTFSLPEGRSLQFAPGQYIDWTLPHHKVDSRGNRRTFTIASSPTEDQLHLGVKFYEPSSSFKQALRDMKVGEQLVAGQLAGSFTLPADPKQELIFIAGGIGVTPFRSMIKYLLDRGERRPLTLFYLINEASEAAYHQVFTEAQSIGLKTIYVIAQGSVPKSVHGYTGLLDEKIFAAEAPRLASSHCYISGPPGMVGHFKAVLRAQGVKPGQIIMDYFPGY